MEMFSNERVTDEQHEQWKAEGTFKGLAVITGKTYHTNLDYPIYFTAIDLDNELAITEFCALFGPEATLEKLAQYLLIELRPDDATKAHVYFFSRKQFKKFIGSINATDDNTIPKIEVKSDSSTIMNIASAHTKGSKYQFLGQGTHLYDGNIKTYDWLEKRIDTLLGKYGIAYLFESDNNNGSKNKADANGFFRFNPDEKIRIGSRHTFLISYANSLIRRLHKTIPIDAIKILVEHANKTYFEEPLPDTEVQKIFDDAIKFIAKQLEQEKENEQENNDKDTQPEKYPELQDNIYHKINNRPEKYVVADKRSNQLKEYEAIHMMVKNSTADIIKYFLVDTSTYLGCIPDKIIKHKNPLTSVRIPELYTISFIDISGERFTLKQKTLPNIIGSLKERACVFKDGANNALNVIIQAFKKRKLVEISEDIPYIGFLPLEGNKILVSNVEIKQPSSDEVAQALSVIEQLEKFYKNRLDLLATGMVWVMIAPFNFIMKTDNYFLKLLNLYGVANSTKTNTALIILAVDGHQEEKGENIYILSYGSVDSNAKFGEAVSKTTFPILIDEIEDLTDERKHSQFTENIKTLAGKKILRKRTSYNRNGEMDEFPALSCAILVSNYSPPLLDSGYMRRTITRNHPVQESIDPEDPRTKIFEKFLGENLRKLKALGDFRNSHVMNNQEIIFNENKPKPLDIGLEILKAAYSYAGKKIPEWLVRERIPETQLVESIQENDVIIKSAFEKYVNEQVVKAISVWRQEDDRFELPKTISKRFVKLIESDLLPDVKFNKSLEILISKGILIELYRHGVKKDQLTDLKSLANYMGGDYRKNNKIFVVVTEARLNDYFNTVVDEQLKIDANYANNGSNGSNGSP
jgi:hypothetical protein